MSHTYAGPGSALRQFDTPGFARHLAAYKPSDTKKKGKTKSNSYFAPTDAQIRGAAGCLVGYLKRINGHHTGHSTQLSGLIGEIQPFIHSRGYRFGRTPADVHTTLLAAFSLLKEQGKVVEVTDSSDRYGVALKGWSPNRKHRDKYVNKMRHGRRRVAA